MSPILSWRFGMTSCCPKSSWCQPPSLGRTLRRREEPNDARSSLSALRYPIEDDPRPTLIGGIASRRHHAVHVPVAVSPRFSYVREKEVLHVRTPQPCHTLLPVKILVRCAMRRAEAHHRAAYKAVAEPVDDRSSPRQAARCIPNDGTVEPELARRTRVPRDATVVGDVVGVGPRHGRQPAPA